MHAAVAPPFERLADIKPMNIILVSWGGLGRKSDKEKS